MEEEVVDYEIEHQESVTVQDSSSLKKGSSDIIVSANVLTSTEEASNSEHNYKIKVKGRGHSNRNNSERYDNRGGIFERIDQERGDGPAQCELWTVSLLNSAPSALITFLV